MCLEEVPAREDALAAELHVGRVCGLLDAILGLGAFLTCTWRRRQPGEKRRQLSCACEWSLQLHDAIKACCGIAEVHLAEATNRGDTLAAVLHVSGIGGLCWMLLVWCGIVEV